MIKINSSKVVISFIVTVEPIDNSIPSDLPFRYPPTKFQNNAKNWQCLFPRENSKRRPGPNSLTGETPFRRRCGEMLLEIRKSQDLAKDFGVTASKPRKKFVNLKIVSYIQKHNKTIIPKMKTKGKEKEKKTKRKEKKRREKGYFRNRSQAL